MILSNSLKKRINESLADLGFDENQISKISLKRVDDFHKNIFIIFIPSANASSPVTLILKILDPKSDWNITSKGIRKEHDFSFYASKMVSGLESRKVAGYFKKTKNLPAIIFYDYLGQAATKIDDPQKILSIVQQSLPLLTELHLKTVSKHFGKSLNVFQRTKEDYFEGVGMEMIRLLLNDIKKDNLDPQGEISCLIEKKWLPILNAEKIFCLIHKDITLSNIIVQNGKVKAFVDWAYSGWEDPAFDLAYLLFWALKSGQQTATLDLFNSILPLYKKVGFNIETTLSFFLAFKCLEYARFKGERWLKLGRELLGASSFKEAAVYFSKKATE